MNAKEIVNKSFEKVRFNGYKTEEVDAYLRDISIEYKKLQNENQELDKKLEVLAEKIREYRNDEDALRVALLKAEKQGISVVNEAKEKAEKIIAEAKEKAAKTTKDADNLAAKKKELAEKSLAEAEEKAKKIVGDAQNKADEIHTVMMQQTEREQIVLQRTRKEVTDYTNKILAAYKTHIEYIKGLPAKCENEFVINTAKEVETRKPSESAFAKKEEPKKPEDKKAVKEAPAKAEEKKEEAVKPEAKKEEPAKTEPKKEEPAKPAAKNEKTADSVLFNLNSEKSDKKIEEIEVLEFGKK